MGVRKKSQKTEFSEEIIQKCLSYDFLSPSTKKYEMFNLFVYGWESDYLTVTKSNYVYEVEIKTSRSDFFNDFKHKEQKHLILEGKNGVIFPYNIDGMCPNYFYYAVPENMISVEEVPEYAGLIYIVPYYGRYASRIIKQAPKLIKEPADISKLKLTDKFYYAYLTWRQKCEANNVIELKKYVKRLEKQIVEYDEMLSEANNRVDELKLELKEYENRGGNSKRELYTS